MTEHIDDDNNGPFITNMRGLIPEHYLNSQLLTLLDWSACYQDLFTRLHPAGFVCPSCGSEERVGHGKTRASFPIYRCKREGCGRTYSILTGTVFCGTSLDARGLVLFMRLLAIGKGDLEIGVEVGLHRNSVADFRRKIETYGKLAR